MYLHVGIRNQTCVLKVNLDTHLENINIYAMCINFCLCLSILHEVTDNDKKIYAVSLFHSFNR